MSLLLLNFILIQVEECNTEEGGFLWTSYSNSSSNNIPAANARKFVNLYWR